MQTIASKQTIASNAAAAAASKQAAASSKQASYRIINSSSNGGGCIEVYTYPSGGVLKGREVCIITYDQKSTDLSINIELLNYSSVVTKHYIAAIKDITSATAGGRGLVLFDKAMQLYQQLKQHDKTLQQLYKGRDERCYDYGYQTMIFLDCNGIKLAGGGYHDHLFGRLQLQTAANYANNANKAEGGIAIA